MWAHFRTGLHTLVEASQKRPVRKSQSAAPQAQSAALTAWPSACSQGSKRHRRLAASQKSPVAAAVQSAVPPHVQFAGFRAVPSELAQ